MSQTTASGGPSTSRPSSRQATAVVQGLIGQQLSHISSSKPASGISRTSGRQVGGPVPARVSEGRTSGSGGKMGATAAVNRTLLLELMHEDDVSAQHSKV